MNSKKIARVSQNVSPNRVAAAAVSPSEARRRRRQKMSARGHVPARHAARTPRTPVVKKKKNRDGNFFVDRDGEEMTNEERAELDKWTNENKKGKMSGEGGVSKIKQLQEELETCHEKLLHARRRGATASRSPASLSRSRSRTLMHSRSRPASPKPVSRPASPKPVPVAMNIQNLVRRKK